MPRPAMLAVILAQPDVTFPLNWPTGLRDRERHFPDRDRYGRSRQHWRASRMTVAYRPL
jgi:hypothetical protein